jgi:hypothetical protein
LSSAQAADPAGCVSNLKQIGLALHHYWGVHNQFPEPFVSDANGLPLYSWRVAFLPYIDVDSKAFFNSFNFLQSWAASANTTAANLMPNVFACPDAPRGGAPYTNYLAVTGRFTAFGP